MVPVCILANINRGSTLWVSERVRQKSACVYLRAEKTERDRNSASPSHGICNTWQAHVQLRCIPEVRSALCCTLLRPPWRARLLNQATHCSPSLALGLRSEHDDSRADCHEKGSRRVREKQGRAQTSESHLPSLLPLPRSPRLIAPSSYVISPNVRKEVFKKRGGIKKGGRAPNCPAGGQGRTTGQGGSRQATTTRPARLRMESSSGTRSPSFHASGPPGFEWMGDQPQGRGGLRYDQVVGSATSCFLFFFLRGLGGRTKQNPPPSSASQHRRRISPACHLIRSALASGTSPRP